MSLARARAFQSLGDNLLGFGRFLRQENVADREAAEEQALREAATARDNARWQQQVTWRNEDATRDQARYDQERIDAANRLAADQKFRAVAGKQELNAEERRFQREKELIALRAAVAPRAVGGGGGAPPRVATTAPGRAPAPVQTTEAERKANMGLGRARDAADLLDQMDDDSGARMMNLPFVGRLAWTGKEKQFEQAAQSFLSSVLRAESGATVTEDELNQAYNIYIPTQFDPPEVRAQKAEARRRALEGVQGAAGRAASPYSPDNPFLARR